ncbi:MHYT domain-containing protein [Actinocorallia longicatena]|uniref:MHYT domain-containing protein n=1 Tax=Actinocorallia longicatena TaxID=111803 RepID=A0ABP6QIB5_9ACTN
MIHHFTYGPVTPVLAYAMSVFGSFLGLRAALRSRYYRDRRRAAWLTAAAVAIGGAGIWAMHFIAMLGFSITDRNIRYDVPLTVASLLIAIVVVACGLFIVGYHGVGVLQLGSAGLITGCGVAAMHYLGMAAMHVGEHVSYDRTLVVLSVVIAVVAATAALWAALSAENAWFTVGAAGVMGAAISSMHYTGMAAMNLHHVSDAVNPMEGAAQINVIIPLMMGIIVVATVISGALVLSPDLKELREEAPAH